MTISIVFFMFTNAQKYQARDRPLDRAHGGGGTENGIANEAQELTRVRTIAPQPEMLRGRFVNRASTSTSRANLRRPTRSSALPPRRGLHGRQEVAKRVLPNLLLHVPIVVSSCCSVPPRADTRRAPPLRRCLFLSTVVREHARCAGALAFSIGKTNSPVV